MWTISTTYEYVRMNGRIIMNNNVIMTHGGYKRQDCNANHI